jgi:hypothetical protein
MSDRLKLLATKGLYWKAPLAFSVITLVCVAAEIPRATNNSARNSTNVLKTKDTAVLKKMRIEGELIVLRPTGFEPRQIRRPAGTPFLLAVDNQSLLPVVSLTLSSSVGLPVLNDSLPRERRIWSDIVNLPRGSYMLREISNPDWTCNIVVE